MKSFLLLIIFPCFVILNPNYLKGQQLPEKPNIIFIMADDLGYGDPGVYGQNKIQTPNIDKLADAGIRFTQAYAGGPVCTSSRSVLMTGLHGGHTPARDNIPHYHTYLQEEDVTIAEVLKQAGYRTGGVGKWSLGDAGTVGSATNQGFDIWLGYLNQDHAHYYYPEYLDFNESKLELADNTLLRQHYSHDILTNTALHFIRNASVNPFFLYVAYTLPHFSAESEDEHGLTVPSVEPYQDTNWNPKAKKYAAMVHMLDRDIGRIVELINELQLEENTLIIFTSDNGGHSNIWEDFDTNGPLRGYKRDLTEGGIRVPFIASWPGTIPAGQVNDEVIAFQDMLPTFAQLAGTDCPENVDGIPVTEALMNQNISGVRKYLYWDYGHTRDRFDQAVRIGDWKGIRLGAGSDIQLYNLAEDISESDNLADKHPDVVHKIKQVMEEGYKPSDRYPVGQKYDGSPIWQPKKLY